jgi:hypothetical protein
LVRAVDEDVNEQRGKVNAALSCEVSYQKSGKIARWMNKMATKNRENGAEGGR